MKKKTERSILGNRINVTVDTNINAKLEKVGDEILDKLKEIEEIECAETKIGVFKPKKKMRFYIYERNVFDGAFDRIIDKKLEKLKK